MCEGILRCSRAIQYNCPSISPSRDPWGNISLGLVASNSCRLSFGLIFAPQSGAKYWLHMVGQFVTDQAADWRRSIGSACLGAACPTMNPRCAACPIAAAVCRILSTFLHALYHHADLNLSFLIGSRNTKKLHAFYTFCLVSNLFSNSVFTSSIYFLMLSKLSAYHS